MKPLAAEGQQEMTPRVELGDRVDPVLVHSGAALAHAHAVMETASGRRIVLAVGAEGVETRQAAIEIELARGPPRDRVLLAAFPEGKQPAAAPDQAGIGRIGRQTADVLQHATGALCPKPRSTIRCLRVSARYLGVRTKQLRYPAP